MRFRSKIERLWTSVAGWRSDAARVVGTMTEKTLVEVLVTDFAQ